MIDDCYPEGNKRQACDTCGRYQPGAPPPANPLPKFPGIRIRERAIKRGEFRAVPVIDATTVHWPDGKCPMHLAKTAQM